MPQETIIYLSALPYSQRKELCSNLDMNAKWRDLAGELGFTPRQINQFEMALHRLTGFNSPSEDLITEYCHKNPTVDDLYFKLNKLQLFSAALTIKDFVLPQALQPREANIRPDNGQRINDETARQQLPRPSEVPIQLLQQNMAYGRNVVTPDRLSNSNNSSGNFAPYNQPPMYPTNPQNVWRNVYGPVQSHGCTAGRREHLTAEHGMQYHGLPSAHIPNTYVPPNPHINGYGNQQNIVYDRAHSTKDPGMEINFNNIKRATYGFDDRKIVVQDRFGVVYKGKLDEQLIAVKQMRRIRDEKTGYDITEHLSKEVDILKRCFHPNIVPLLKYIDETDGEGSVYLVYPHMDNGTLRQNLEKKDNKESLKWECKIKILKEAASGLVYLHNQLGQKPYVHGDISSDNILLDEMMAAKLTGFGLAQAATGGSNYQQHTHVSHAFLKNTLFGAQEYLPPEFKELPELSVKGDVFAVGVVILETCTGLKAFDDRREGGKLLWEYVSQLGDNSEEFAASLNDRRQPMPYNTWEKLFNLGKKCISRKKKHRPTAKEVLTVLENVYEKDVCDKNGQYIPQFSNKAGQDPNKSLQIGYTSYIQEYDTDAINPHTPAFHSSTTVKRPIDGFTVMAGVPSSHQGSNMQCAPGYSLASQHFDDPWREPTENTSRSDSSGVGTQEMDGALESIVYERPGNTCELPRFVTCEQVTDTNVRNARPLAVCVEQTESYQTGSNNSKQQSTDYDYAKSDMSFLTGSTVSSCSDRDHDYRKTDMAILSDFSSVQQTINSDIVTDISDLSQSASQNDELIVPSSDTADSDRPDYRQSDLDIITAPSSMTSQQSDTSCSSVAKKIVSKQKSINSDDKLKSSTPYEQHFKQSNLEALNRHFNNLSTSTSVAYSGDDGLIFDTQTDNVTQQMYSPVSLTSESLDIRFPGGLTQEHCKGVLPHDIGAKLQSSDPIGFFQDNKVSVNDSVAFFVDNPNCNSNASSLRPNDSAKSTRAEEIHFDYGKEDSTSIGWCPANLSGIEKKAGDLFDLDSVDVDCDLDPNGEFDNYSDDGCFGSGEILTSRFSDVINSDDLQM